MDEGAAIIVVSDNGLGMPEAKYNELRDGLRLGARTDKMLGILNTHNRLKLYFGGNSGVTVTSAEGAGTTVTIRMEANKVNGGNKNNLANKANETNGGNKANEDNEANETNKDNEANKANGGNKANEVNNV
jgi:hypothetical protein